MAQPQKKVNAEKLLPEVVSAALGTKTFKQATKGLSQMDADKLSRALGVTVEEFRLRFAEQLKLGAQEALDLLRLRLGELKAGELAFALSVLTDKANAMESRSSTLSASVAHQVNNFYVMDKDALLDQLAGKKPPTPVHPTPSPAISPISQEKPIDIDVAQPLPEAIEHSEAAIDSVAAIELGIDSNHPKG